MNEAQRDLLAKGLADIAKGLFIAAPIAMGAGKISILFGLSVMAVSVAIFNLGYAIAGDAQTGGDDHGTA
jgi:hypothetical protein